MIQPNQVVVPFHLGVLHIGLVNAVQMTECAEIRSGEKGVRLFIENMEVKFMFGICDSKGKPEDLVIEKFENCVVL
jgi:hypothetical protein